MEVIGIIIALLAGAAAIFGKTSWAALLVAVLAFGPVIVQYAQTGDSTLWYEAGFRFAIFSVCVWAAFKFRNFDQKPQSNF